jgi:hypothetical protein
VTPAVLRCEERGTDQGYRARWEGSHTMIIDQTMFVAKPQFAAWWTQSLAPSGERQVAIQIGDALNLIVTTTELRALADTIAAALKLPVVQRDQVEVITVPLF